MKVRSIFLFLTLLSSLQGAESTRKTNTVILDSTGVKNLRIETAEIEETTFEESIFSLGRIGVIPAKRSAVSSRIMGRVVEIKATQGDLIAAGAEVARVESRQAGDPPPTVSLKAPAGGIVTKIDTVLGDPVEPDRSIMEITDLSEVFAIARVPEQQAGRMKPGTVAHIRVTALPDEPFEGELLRFGTEADRQSGTIDAIFKLPNPNFSIRPGMRAEFSIVLSKREGVSSVPRSALQGDVASRFIYVKDFDLPNAFIKTPVEVGQVNDRFAEITSGILPGETVVTKGAYSLSFAGTSSVSLKEALDAAHGHEHAEDGSELTEAKKAEMAAKKRAAAGLAPPAEGGGNPIWMYSTGILFVLLLIALFKRKTLVTDKTPVSNTPRKEAA